MSNFRTREPHYLQARRALRRLRVKHSQDFMDWAVFSDADERICPELYREPETQYGSSFCYLDDALINTVADAYGIDPVLLDDMLIAADYEEQNRTVEACLRQSVAGRHLLRLRDLSSLIVSEEAR